MAVEKQEVSGEARSPGNQETKLNIGGFAHGIRCTVNRRNSHYTKLRREGEPPGRSTPYQS